MDRVRVWRLQLDEWLDTWDIGACGVESRELKLEVNRVRFWRLRLDWSVVAHYGRWLGRGFWNQDGAEKRSKSRNNTSILSFYVISLPFLSSFLKLAAN